MRPAMPGGTLQETVGLGLTMRAECPLENMMSELTDKLDAAGNKIAGKAKELAGKVTGNEKLEAEGDAQQLKGSAQNLKGDIKGKINNL